MLNNLRQLHRVAEDDWDDDGARLVAEVIRAARGEGGRRSLLAELIPAGMALNELAHRANAAEHLPSEAPEVLAAMHTAVRGCLP